MTIYAPADFRAVSVPADHPVHPGCGQVHIRPEGARPWALTCEPCETHLAAVDPRWVRTVADIAETYDERKDRKSLAIRGSRDRDDILALALARLAGLDLPPSLAGGRERLGIGSAVPGTVACPAGHAQQPGQSFCGACGLPMRQAAGQVA